MKREKLTTMGIAILILLIAGVIIYIKNNPINQTPDEIAKCIGKNSMLYVQLGCHACQAQEDLFGTSYQYLTKIDCWFEKEKCAEIRVTPTWIIKGQKYEGVQAIQTLQNLTGC
jgi:hypothetical protein